MPHPLVLEINCRCWLQALGDRLGKTVRLDTIPKSEFAGWQRLGFTHIWLMGVWTVGEKSRRHALLDRSLRAACHRALPDCRDEDIGGSPYSIAGYRVSRDFGGEPALAKFRKHLREAGIGLILDFIPNHVGIDHPWLTAQPDFFIQTTRDAPESHAHSTDDGERHYECGKDPYFPAWRDTVQLDIRNPSVREALTTELAGIARLCDGVRCDMAMLLLEDVFQKTWAGHPAAAPVATGEFWEPAISAIRRDHPGFLFIAEVYWDLEFRLQELGFDFTYDKWLYDHSKNDNGAEAQSHLLNAADGFVERCVHFLENHDEPRAAAHFNWDEHQTAAVLMSGLPGMRLLHMGQLRGSRIQSPVQLNRWPDEPADERIHSFYDLLLGALKVSSVGRGRHRMLLTHRAWDGNESHMNIVAIQWQRQPDTFDLVVVNLAPSDAQCFVRPRIDELARRRWQMNDLLSDETHHRSGNEMARDGLYLALPGRKAQVFHFMPA